MNTDLTPIEQDPAQTLTLGYTGIEKLDELQAQSRARVEITTEVGVALAKNHFRIYNDSEVRKMMRQMTRANSRLRIKARRQRVSYLLVSDPAATIYAFTAGLAIFGVVGAPLTAKLLLWVTSGWAADLPVLLAAGAGVAMPIFWGICSLFALYVWNLSEFAGFGYTWHRIPIAEYLPPLISRQQLERLEQLNTELSKAGVKPAFFIRHGTADEKDSLTKSSKSITEQGKRLKRWREEGGFIELDMTFPDGETTTLTIARTSSFI
jgi:hypothetical protein